MNKNFIAASNINVYGIDDEIFAFIRANVHNDIKLPSLINKKVLLRNWDDTVDWAYIVCIEPKEVLGEEVVTVLYDSDNEVQKMDLGFMISSIKEVYEPDLARLESAYW